MLFAILFCFTASFALSQQIFQSESFAIQLKEDSSFIYYPNEVSLKTLVAGDFIMREDSLILTTHQYNGETAIFAIYQITPMKLGLIYAQKAFRPTLSTTLAIHKELHPNNKVKNEYYWMDQAKGSYSKYQFSPEGYLLAVENYDNYLLEGKQLYFHPTRESVLKKELLYREGKLHGKAYYYELDKADDNKLALVLKEKYKNGKLRKAKKPVTPPTFYTRHF